MPTSSSGSALVGSHYTIAPQPYVDIRRFSFFKEQQFDIREALSSSERISKVPRAALAMPQVLDAGIAPLSLVATPRAALEGRYASNTPWQLPSSSSQLLGLSSPAPSVLSSSVRTPRPPPTLKPLMSLTGDIIWTAGRSRAMEACDAAQLTYDAGSDDSDLGVSEHHPLNNAPAVVPKPPALRLTSQQPALRDTLELQSFSSVAQNMSLSIVESSSLEHGGGSILVSAQPTALSTIPSSRAIGGRRHTNLRPDVHHLPPASAAIPLQHRMSMSTSTQYESNTATSPPFASGKLSSRRQSQRGKNARLARQLTKQSQELQERLLALHATDDVHRQEISRIGARLLGGFGYVAEMDAFVHDVPPLPHGTHYKNLHPLDHVAEVRIDEGGMCPLDGGGRARQDERLAEEANKEVRWTAVLKKDVNIAAAQEELRRSMAHAEASPHLRRHTPPLRSRLATSTSPPANGASATHILLDDVSRLADERLEQELRGRALASMNPQDGGRYSDAVMQKEEAEQATIRDILFTEQPQETSAREDSRPYQKKVAKKKNAGAFGDRSAHKRVAVVDTSALEARMARGNTDTSLLGSQAAVDLKLFRKDPKLFSIAGEDTDPRAFPTFPFNKNELVVPREDGFGISIYDPKSVVEDKAYSERYNQQNLSDKLERTHVVRRLLNQVFATHAGNLQEGDDEDGIAAKEDFDRWRRAAGALPTSAQRGDAAERIRKEVAYTWHQVAKDHAIPEMPRL